PRWSRRRVPLVPAHRFRDRFGLLPMSDLTCSSWSNRATQVTKGLMDAPRFHGSHGEHLLQEQLGSSARANAFYRKQMPDRLNAWMRKFIAKQEMVFIASADANGECDCSFRAGMKGFVRVLDEQTLVYPEYRGNGVLASLGNVVDNPHLGMIFVDFFRHTIG